MMKNILFGIVCFREHFWESESFLGLINSYNQSNDQKEINIFIFDNTDLPNWELEPPKFSANVKLNYIHFSANPGIALAYNRIADFAKNNHFQWLVFLDQDSALPMNAYEIYQNFANLNKDGIAAPKVISNNKIISPSYYKYYRTSPIVEIGNRIKLRNVTCINSGLMISVSSYFLSGGYSSALRLDFCDHEFIERASQKLENLNLLNFTIHQDFSTDTNDLQKAIFRYKLFLKDLKAYRKIHKNTILINLRVDLPHLLRLTLQYKTLAFFKVRAGYF